VTRAHVARTYRVVKLIADGRHAWLVVSASLRDDDTWDVIYKAGTRTEAYDYVDEVVQRNQLIAREPNEIKLVDSVAVQGRYGRYHRSRSHPRATIDV
jgi:hypothetical protein